MIKNLTINERILYLIDNQYGGNQKKFADSIGYAPQVVFNIVAGRKSSPSYDVLNAIISTNDTINTDWLLTGKGEMLKSDIKISKSNETEIEYLKKINELQEYKIKQLEEENNRYQRDIEFSKKNN
jgi:hypothetical protein